MSAKGVFDGNTVGVLLGTGDWDGSGRGVLFGVFTTVAVIASPPFVAVGCGTFVAPSVFVGGGVSVRLGVGVKVGTNVSVADGRGLGV